MASDLRSTKRKAASAHQYQLVACALCALSFDEAEHTPRLVACGHTFCSACIRAHTRNISFQNWHFTCPADREETSVLRGNPASLELCAGLVTTTLPLFRIYLKNMAGDTTPLFVNKECTVGDVKIQLHRANNMYFKHLLRLTIQIADDEFVALEDDTAMLGALGIGSERVVSVVVRDGYRGGEHIRSIGQTGTKPGKFKSPSGMCFSPNAKLLYVADSDNNRVQVFHTSDGSHVRTIEISITGTTATGLEYPSGICISPNGELLFVSRTHGVQVVRAFDGAHIRTVGSPNHGRYDQSLYNSRGVSYSPIHDLLFASDILANYVLVFRASDGVYLRTIGSQGNGPRQLNNPCGMCLSPNGESLFVADASNDRVQVFCTSDGSHERSIGSHGYEVGQFECPLGVCISPSGEWLFVADMDNHRMQVLRASDGTHMHSIGSYGSDIGQFNFPHGLCISPGGDLLAVSDCYNHRVQIFTA